ncbi:MAG: hypothetical protein Q9164_003181 [Protoblastenia rupestris]
MSRETSASPSEGEIVESGSEKAITSINSYKGTTVNPQFRHRVTVSRSPSPSRSPGPYRSRPRSRDGSRSPYRESRGSKRPHKDDHYDRSRNDPRRFKVRYEDPEPRERGVGRSSYHDLDRTDVGDQRLRHTENPIPHGRSREQQPHHRRGRSPPYQKGHGNPFDKYGSRGGRDNGRSWREQGERKYGESRDTLSNEQSVSDRGQTPIAAAQSKHEAETSNVQTQHSINGDTSNDTSQSAKYVPPLASLQCADDLQNSNAALSADQANDAAKPGGEAQLDEAALIEERRKRREAIKAKYRGQATPTIVQSLALESTCEPTTPKALAAEESHVGSGKETVEVQSLGQSTHTDLHQESPPSTPKDVPGQDSPANLVVLEDTDLANSNAAANTSNQDEEPSAADYDPTMDMQEDKLRHDEHQRKDEVSASAYNETKQADQDVLIPYDAADTTHETKADGGFDMFAEGDDGLDMFAEAPTAPLKIEREITKAVPVPQAKALDMSMLDDWDDSEGYYKVILGELLDGRYHVQSNLGKGMFSGVVRATDQKTKRVVAIKLIRNNETMKKAGLKEIDILLKLTNADPEDKKHIIRLERFFEHKGHLCMVFENLSINLREVLKKFGRDVGINLKAVRAYAQQMFLGLTLLRKCNVLHADLKPDNVLVNESRNVLKICDLGSASDASENEITQYLVSRFYRAPEIILGMPYDFAIDMWSIGCTLFELYTGKILFTGRSNNQMLRAIMECRGKISHKILRKAQFLGYHFDNLLNFRSVEKDRMTGKDTVRVMNFTKPTRDLKTRLMVNVRGMDDAEVKELNLFVDLLDRCLNLNPEKRCTPTEALRHPFIMRPRD